MCAWRRLCQLNKNPKDMKRILLFVFSAAVLGACAKPVADIKAPLLIGATREALAEDMVKSNVSDQGKFIWNTWDEADIWTTAGSFSKMSVESGGGTNSVNFIVSIPEGAEASTVAVYPSGAHSLNGNILTVNYPSEYTYQADTTDSYPLMVAKYTAGSGLSFKHVGGLMRVRYKNVPTKAHSILLTFDNEKVTGNFDVDLTAAEPVATFGAGSSSVRIRFTPPTTATNTRHFYVPLPTGTLTKMTIVYCDENDEPIKGTSYTKTGSLELTRRKLVRMPGLVLTTFEAGIE